MKNIVILGLNYEYNIQIGQLLTEKLDMYLLDFKQYVEYDLFSTKDMLEKCGVDYLNKQEKKCLKKCSEFEKSVICVPYSYFFDEDAYKLFKSDYIVYLYFSKQKLQNVKSDDTLALDLIVFDERDQDLSENCNKKIVVSNKKPQTIVNEIISYVRG